MKAFIFTLLIVPIYAAAFGQKDLDKNLYMKFSGGRVSFGTSDFFGYSILIEVSKDIIKKPSFAIDKLLVGGELIFENGVKDPIIHNATFEEYLHVFQHVSSSLLWPKVSYYPFKKIIRGFNIQIGPTFGYSYRSTEAMVSQLIDNSGQSTRQSTLSYNNNFTIGYRISTGLEFNLIRKIFTGFRLDFSNNKAGEINTLAGIKFGIKL